MSLFKLIKNRGKFVMELLLRSLFFLANNQYMHKHFKQNNVPGRMRIIIFKYYFFSTTTGNQRYVLTNSNTTHHSFFCWSQNMCNNRIYSWSAKSHVNSKSLWAASCLFKCLPSIFWLAFWSRFTAYKHLFLFHTSTVAFLIESFFIGHLFSLISLS